MPYYDEYLSYLVSPQYLGTEGITHHCLEAMVAVLAGPFRPKKITAVMHRGSGREHDLVLFLIWDWPRDGKLAIIPDGFGTHGGTGGAGLEMVLGLIKYYEIPLFEARLHEPTDFRALAQGRLEESTLYRIVAMQYPSQWDWYEVGETWIVQRNGKRFLEVAESAQERLPPIMRHARHTRSFELP